MFILTALAGVALLGIAVTWWKRRRTARLVEQLAYSAIVAGAIGNLVDRLYRGHVIDFIHQRYWPVFNVADILIVVGVALLLVVSLSLRHTGNTRAA